MAGFEHYADLVSQILKCEEQSEKFLLSKISSSIVCASSYALCNSSSNELLLRHLYKSNLILDDQTENNLDNYACAIETLVSSRPQERHCRQWKSELSGNLHEFMSKLESDDRLKCPHSDRELSCQSHLLDQDEIKLLLLNTSICLKEESNIYAVDPSMLNTNRNTTADFQTNNTDDIATKNITKTILPQGLNKPNTCQQFFLSNSKKSSIQDNQSGIGFKTARNEWISQNQKNNSGKPFVNMLQSASQKKCLGARGSTTKFISPMITNDQPISEKSIENNEIEDERLKHIDPKMVELIRSEIIDHGTPIGWDDIAGLEFAKTVIQEAVVWPLLRPDIFTGLRRPPKGILLFGPPGTGKTLIGKCIASQCSATFFSISASSLTSKWLGDGEKMVRALFAVARCHQPAVVFIDEIDSLLTQRSDSEHESTRRIKTEFLVQLDGAATAGDDRLLLIGATNRPQELDEAARRRLVKRLYIPLPNHNARCQIVQRLMSTERHSLSVNDVDEVARITEGFSGADMQSLCSEAALQPIRAVPFAQIVSIHSDQVQTLFTGAFALLILKHFYNKEVRPVTVDDFKFALKRVRPSVSSADLHLYEKWDRTYGSGTPGNLQL